MSGAATVLLGAVLTFGSSDGRTLQLTVSLTESATAALAWGDVVHTATIAKTRHVFRGLPTPTARSLEYTLAIGREAPRREKVLPLRPDHLRFAVYGDSRDGSAPHQILVRAMAAASPELVVHTGDVVARADDDVGWVRHLAATMPLTAKTPVILSLGNHELQRAKELGIDALAKALGQIPPPDDPLARSLGVPPSVFHVRAGPALFVSLDSNERMGVGTPQHRFLDRALAEKGDARWTFVSYHHGPRSSGPHGPHPDADDVIALLVKHGVTASLSGHDHTYERIVDDGRTYVVSGGGGAPLYTLTSKEPGSQAFASTYNWVMLEAGPTTVELEARSLEGVLLDRATVAPIAAKPLPAAPSMTYTFGAIGLLLAALAWVAVRITLGRVRA